MAINKYGKHTFECNIENMENFMKTSLKHNHILSRMDLINPTP
jgi:hypothetical protein